MDRIIDGWVASNRLLIRMLRLTVLDLRLAGDAGFTRGGWYLIVSNHQSWADILMLQEIFLGRVPPLKFFTKRELIWAPLVGVAMWLLGFPVRASLRARAAGRAPGTARPRPRRDDACLRAASWSVPTSVLSFLEGTRFTARQARCTGNRRTGGC